MRTEKEELKALIKKLKEHNEKVRKSIWELLEIEEIKRK